MADVTKNVEIALKIVGANDKTLTTLVGAFEKIQTAVNSTTESVLKLKTTLESIKVPTGMTNVTTAFKELNGIKFSNLEQIATGFTKLKEIGTPIDLKPFAIELKKLQAVGTLPNLGQIGIGLEKIIKTPLSSFAAKITTLETQLSRLSKVGTLPNLGQIGTGLEKILSKSNNLGQLGPKVGSLVTQLGRLAKIGPLPNLGQIGTGLEKIMKTNLSGFSDKITTVEAGLKRLAAVNLSNLAVILTKIGNTNLGKVTEQLKKTEQAIKATGDTARTAGLGIGTFVGKVKTFTQFRFIAEVFNVLKQAMKGGVSAIVEYDQALKDLQAITDSTSLGVAQMGIKILEVASTTKFSASEVAEGMRIIGQAGFSASEAVQVMGDVANLATGTLSTMASTVDLVTTTLRVFRIDASESASVVDVFANAVNGSKLTIDKLRTSMNYVGPIARDAGVSFKELAASMMTLANSGLRASSIGTGLRRVFAELIDPSKKLAAAADRAGISLRELDPRAGSLSDVLTNLGIVIDDAGIAFDVFGKRGASAVLALTSEGSKFETLLKSVSTTGTAARQAATQIEGLGVSIKNAQDKLGVLSIKIGEAGLAGAIKYLIDLFAGLTDGLIYFAGTAIGKVVIGLGILTTAFLTATAAVVAFGQAFLVLSNTMIIKAALGAVTAAFTTFAAELMTTTGALAVAFIPVIGQILLVVAAVGAGIAAIIHFTDRSKKLAEETAKVSDEYQVVSKSLQDYSVKMATLAKDSADAEAANKALRTSLFKVAEEYKEVSGEALRAALSINPLTGEIKDGSVALQAYAEKLKLVTAQKLVDSVKAANNAFKELEIVPEDLDFTGPLTKTNNSFKEMQIYVAELDRKLGELTSSEKEASEGLGLISETADKALISMEKMGKLNLYDTEEEFRKLAEILGISGVALDAMAFKFNEMKQGSKAKNIVEKWGEDALKGADNIARATAIIEENGIDWDAGDKAASEKAASDRAGLIKTQANLYAKAQAEAKHTKDVKAVWKKYATDYAALQEDIDANLKSVYDNRSLQNGIALADEYDQWQKSIKKIETLWSDPGHAEKLASELAKVNAIWTNALKNAKAGIPVDYKAQTLEYNLYLKQRKTDYSDHLLELEKERLTTGMSDEDYNAKKIKLELDFYATSLSNAKKYSEALKETTQDPKALAKAEADLETHQKKLLDIKRKYLLEGYKDAKSAQDKLSELKDKEIAEDGKYDEKIGSDRASHLEDLAELQATHEEKIKSIKEASAEKIKSIDNEIADNKKALASELLGLESSTAEKIRQINKRGMTDAEKEASDSNAAQKALSEGKALITKAESDNDAEALKQGIARIKQSESLAVGLKNENTAVVLLRSALSSLKEAAQTKERLKELDLVAKKEKEIASASKKLSAENSGYAKKTKDAKESFSEITIAENKRHLNALGNIKKEQIAENEKFAQSLRNIDSADPTQNHSAAIKSIEDQTANLKNQIAVIGSVKNASLNSIKATSAANTKSTLKTVSEMEDVSQNRVRSFTELSNVATKTYQTIDAKGTQAFANLAKGAGEILTTMGEDGVRSFAIAGEEAKKMVEEVKDVKIFDTEALADGWSATKDIVDEIVNSTEIKIDPDIDQDNKLMKFKKDMDAIIDKYLNIFISIPQLSMFNKFKQDWDDLKNKTITLTTRYKNEGDASGGSGEVITAAQGGRLPGFGGGDRNPALLEDGEWVINKFAVRKFGDSFMSSINNMTLPKFQNGGKVATSVAPEIKGSSSVMEGLANFGKVVLDTGKVKFPALVHRDVASELSSHLTKMRLMGANT